MAGFQNKIVSYLKEDFEKNRGDVLLYGDPEESSLMLKEMCAIVSEHHKDMIPSYHNASEINAPEDFFCRLSN